MLFLIQGNLFDWQYILKDSAKGAKKSKFFVASKQENQSVTSVAKEIRENGTGEGLNSLCKVYDPHRAISAFI